METYRIGGSGARMRNPNMISQLEDSDGLVRAFVGQMHIDPVTAMVTTSIRYLAILRVRLEL